MVGVHHLPYDVLSNIVEQLDFPDFINLLSASNRFCRVLGLDLEALCLNNGVWRLPGETWRDAIAQITQRGCPPYTGYCSVDDGALMCSRQGNGIIFWHRNMYKPAVLFDARLHQRWVDLAFITDDRKRLVLTTFTNPPDEVSWGVKPSEFKVHIFDTTSFELIDSPVLGEARDIDVVGGRLFFHCQTRVLFNPRNGQTVEVPTHMELLIDYRALYDFVDEKREIVLLLETCYNGIAMFDFATAQWKEIRFEVYNPESPFYGDDMSYTQLMFISQYKNYVLVARPGLYLVDLSTGAARAIGKDLDVTWAVASTKVWLNPAENRLESYDFGDDEKKSPSVEQADISGDRQEEKQRAEFFDLVSGEAVNFIEYKNKWAFVHKGFTGRPLIKPLEDVQTTLNAKRALFKDLLRAGALSPGRLRRIALQ